MRAFRSLLVPILFGVVLLAIALITRSGKLARENPGAPINSAMREAMGMMLLPPADQAWVDQRYPNAEVTDSGLRYLIEKPGDGETRPQRAQPVVIRFRTTLLDGTVVEEGGGENQRYVLPAGQARTIPGLDEAIMDMTLGEARTLIIPYWLGYGEDGIKKHVPGKATLVTKVKLVDIPNAN